MLKDIINKTINLDDEQRYYYYINHTDDLEWFYGKTDKSFNMRVSNKYNGEYIHFEVYGYGEDREPCLNIRYLGNKKTLMTTQKIDKNINPWNMTNIDLAYMDIELYKKTRTGIKKEEALEQLKIEHELTNKDMEALKIYNNKLSRKSITEGFIKIADEIALCCLTNDFTNGNELSEAFNFGNRLIDRCDNFNENIDYKRGESRSTIGKNSVINISLYCNIFKTNDLKETTFSTNIDNLDTLNQKYGFSQPSDYPNITSRTWFSTEPVLDYKTGYNKDYTLQIHDIDGLKPTIAQMKIIAETLGIKGFEKKDIKEMKCYKYIGNKRGEKNYIDALKRKNDDFFKFQVIPNPDENVHLSKGFQKAFPNQPPEYYCLIRTKSKNKSSPFNESVDLWYFKKDFNDSSAREFIKQWDESHQNKEKISVNKEKNIIKTCR